MRRRDILTMKIGAGMMVGKPGQGTQVGRDIHGKPPSMNHQLHGTFPRTSSFLNFWQGSFFSTGPI